MYLQQTSNERKMTKLILTNVSCTRHELINKQNIAGHLPRNREANKSVGGYVYSCNKLFHISYIHSYYP